MLRSPRLYMRGRFHLLQVLQHQRTHMWSAASCAAAGAPVLHAQRRWQSASGSPDPYATLGVSPSATPEEIKVAYKKMALKYHPDRNKDPGAEERFKEVSQAYNLLSNRSQRQQYDAMHGAYRQPGGGGSSSSAAGGGPRAGHPDFGSVKWDSRMSNAEAEALFRNMFGNMDDLMRKMQTPGGAPGSSGAPRGPSGGSSFSQSRQSRMFVDDRGDVHNETIYRDPMTGRTIRHTRIVRDHGETEERREVIQDAQQFATWNNLHSNHPPPGFSDHSHGRHRQDPFHNHPNAGAASGGNPWQGNPFAGAFANSMGGGNPFAGTGGGSGGTPFGFGNQRRQSMWSNPFRSFNGGGQRGGRAPYFSFNNGGGGLGGASLLSILQGRALLVSVLMAIMAVAVLSFLVTHPLLFFMAILIVLILRRPII